MVVHMMSQGWIQGGHGGQMIPLQPEKDDELQKEMSYYPTQLQIFQIFSCYCCIYDCKLTSTAQNFIEMEHFSAKPEPKFARSR